MASQELVGDLSHASPVERRFVSTVDDRDVEFQDALHARDVVRHVGPRSLGEQDVVVDQVAGDEDTRLPLVQPDAPGRVTR